MYLKMYLNVFKCNFYAKLIDERGNSGVEILNYQKTAQVYVCVCVCACHVCHRIQEYPSRQAIVRISTVLLQDSKSTCEIEGHARDGAFSLAPIND